MDIKIQDFTGTFAENKDTAKTLRETLIRTAIQEKELIRFNFQNIDSTTQSFIHALISDAFQKHGESALEMFEFKNCNAAVKSLIKTVINYSLD